MEEMHNERRRELCRFHNVGVFSKKFQKNAKVLEKSADIIFVNGK